MMNIDDICSEGPTETYGAPWCRSRLGGLQVFLIIASRWGQTPPFQSEPSPLSKWPEKSYLPPNFKFQNPEPPHPLKRRGWKLCWSLRKRGISLLNFLLTTLKNDNFVLGKRYSMQSFLRALVAWGAIVPPRGSEESPAKACYTLSNQIWNCTHPQSFSTFWIFFFFKSKFWHPPIPCLRKFLRVRKNWKNFRAYYFSRTSIFCNFKPATWHQKRKTGQIRLDIAQ